MHKFRCFFFSPSRAETAIRIEIDLESFLNILHNIENLHFYQVAIDIEVACVFCYEYQGHGVSRFLESQDACKVTSAF